MRKRAAKVLGMVLVLALSSAVTTLVSAEKPAEKPAKKKSVRLYAVITELPSTPGWIGDWVVGNRVVHVSDKTRIEQMAGPPVVGVYVKLEGEARADGSIDASKIETKFRAGGGTHPIKFRGTIESLPLGPGLIGDWRVSERLIRVTAMTVIRQQRNAVAVGIDVTIQGFERNDGSLDAIEIVTENSPNNASRFTGVVESLPSNPERIGDWTVSGRTVRVTVDTRIDEDRGRVAVGSIVEVKGAPQSDGSIVAAEIEVKSAMAGNAGSHVKFFGVIEVLPEDDDLAGEWRVSGRRVEVDGKTKIRREDGVEPAIGRVVEVNGRVGEGGVVSARMIVVKGTMHGGLAQHFGVIESLPEDAQFVGDWTVGGKTVHVTERTMIKREYRGVAVGAIVEVRGRIESDGSITAVRIEVKQGANGGGFIALGSPAISASAASYGMENAPAGIVAAFGSGLSEVTAAAGQMPLPEELGGVSVLVDGEPAGLFFVSPGQINYELPQGALPGSATMVVMRDGAVVAEGVIEIEEIAPSLFTADASGSGAPAGLLLRVSEGGEQTLEPLALSNVAGDGFEPAPIRRGAGERHFLVLFGTGFRGAPNLDGDDGNGAAESVTVTIGGVSAEVTYAASVAGFIGLDQMNIELPSSVSSGALVNVEVKIRNSAGDLVAANTVTIAVE